MGTSIGCGPGCTAVCDLRQAVLALLGFSLPPLEGPEALCPKIIERWEAEPWKGFQIPHRDFALSVRQSLQCMVVFIPLTTFPPSNSLQVCPGTQGGYHAANRWDIVIQPLRGVTLLRGSVIHRGAGGPVRPLFIPFAPVGYRSRMLTVEPESVTELMNSVPVMPSELLAEGAAVGSPLGTEASLNFNPLDQGSEEAEAVPATDPVPAPQEDDMPEAPADAEERPAAPADANAAPPPPLTASTSFAGRANPPPPIWSCWPRPFCGRAAKMATLRELVGDAGDRRLIAPPTFPGGLEVHLLEHRRAEFHRGELRQSGPQILGDDAVILAVARRGKTLLRDDGGIGVVVGGDGVGVVEGGVGATHAKHGEGGVGAVEGGVGDVRDVGAQATVGGERREGCNTVRGCTVTPPY